MNSRQKIRDLNITIAHETGDEIYCYCPFHADKRASLCVNAKKPVWFCHSCERGGTLNKLERLMEKEGIVEHVPEDEPQKRYPLAKMEIEDYYELPLATNCQYLVKRGFDNDSVKAWEIRRSTIFAVLPLKNGFDNVEGLILRSMIKDYQPRYQAKHFKKKEHLFGKRTSYDSNKTVILVEGPLDAVKVWQNLKELKMLKDFAGVYAAMGSSMSPTQLEILSKVSNEILLLMDNEESGKVATQKCARSLLGFNLFVPDKQYYTSKDPGDMNEKELYNIVTNQVPYLKARLKGWL